MRQIILIVLFALLAPQANATSLFGCLARQAVYEVDLGGRFETLELSDARGRLWVETPKGMHSATVRRAPGVVVRIDRPYRIGE